MVFHGTANIWEVRGRLVQNAARQASIAIDLMPLATGVRIWHGEDEVSGAAVVVDLQQTTRWSLTGQVYPAPASQALIWTSSNAQLATVDASGNITFLKPGAVNIRCMVADGSQRNTTVTVTITNTP